MPSRQFDGCLQRITISVDLTFMVRFANISPHRLLCVIVAPSCVGFIDRLRAGFAVSLETDVALRLQKLDHIVAATFDRLHVLSGLT